MSHRYVFALIPFVLAACSGASSHPTTASSAAAHPAVRTNSADAVATIADAVAAAPAPPAPGAVVIVPPSPAHSFAVFSLPEGQRLWQSPEPIDARPWIAGDLVISHARGHVIAWDLRTGHERWREGDHGLALIGAASDGHAVAISLGTGGLENRDGVALVLDHDSGARRYADTEGHHALGPPAVAGGYAFFPWDGQNLSVVDANGGYEIARITDLEDFTSRVVREGDAVYFGGARLYRFAREAASGRRAGAATYGLPREDLPGRPHVLPSGYYAPYAGLNARERVGVVVRPDPSAEGVRLLDDALYFVFDKVVFAFDATNGTARWAYVSPVDIAGATPVRGALVLADEHGHLAWIDARAGNVTGRALLGTAAVQAVFQAPTALPAPHVGETPVQPATATFVAAATVDDERLVPARVLAVRILATMRGGDATHALVTVASDPALPAELRTAAGEALSNRTDGTRTMIETLATHYDYYRRTPAPPVGFLARALANAHDRRAVAPLIAHLQDPYTPAAELPPLVTALRDLGDPLALPALIDFLTIYHADDAARGASAANNASNAERDAIQSALGLAAEAVLAIGGPSQRHTLQALQQDPATVAPVRAALAHALAPPARAAATAPRASTAPTTTTASTASTATTSSASTAPAAAAADDHSALPPRVTAPMITRAFAPVRARMLHCLPRNGAALTAPVSVQFRYDGDGHVLNAVVQPATYQACIAPIATTVQLPRTQVFREVRVYQLSAAR